MNTHTEINVRAFNSDFTITVDKKKGPMTLKQAIHYVIKTLEWETATVTSVKVDGKVIKNKP